MHRLFKLATTSAALATVAAATVGISGASAADAKLPVKDPAGAEFTEMGGATPLATDKTVAHWHGQFTDPSNGVTYGYNMVGADPKTDGDTTTPTDIIPINISFSANNGKTLNGTDVTEQTAGSPIFQGSDYSSTENSSAGHGGELSLGNTDVQYEDAIMRSQFNKTDSPYHVRLGQPTVHAPINLTVPKGKGSAYQTHAGVVFGLVDMSWFSSRVQQWMGQEHTDPTHLPIFLTNNVMLYDGTPDNCCVIGYHGASVAVGYGSGATSGQGRQGVQTFAFSAYTTPGTFRGDYIKDIHALSHEIAEWGDDPFVNNTVDPWLTPTAPQYGCTGILETGDPVVGIGFTLPGNSADANGNWHPEDEVFLPWFAREAPNKTSQPVQDGTDGRYTFMGDLNPYPGFQAPATGCS